MLDPEVVMTSIQATHTRDHPSVTTTDFEARKTDPLVNLILMSISGEPITDKDRQRELRKHMA